MEEEEGSSIEETPPTPSKTEGSAPSRPLTAKGRAGSSPRASRPAAPASARFSARWTLVYLLCIVVVFGVAHGAFGTLEGTGGATAGFADSLYFSVVTATTLGYGDVLPKPGLGRVLAVAEVLVGVLVVGLFLNSLWTSYTDRVAEEEKRFAARQARITMARRLSTYLRYFETVYARWIAAQQIVTDSTGQPPSPTGPRTEWEFTDLKWMFHPSRSTLNAVSVTAVEAYYEALAAIARELRFVISHFDLLDEPDVYDRIVDFLAATDKYDARGALAAYPSVRLGEGGQTAAEFAAEMIGGVSIDPSLDAFPHNVLTPVVFFHHGLRDQTRLTPEIRAALRRIADEAEAAAPAGSGSGVTTVAAGASPAIRTSDAGRPSA